MLSWAVKESGGGFGHSQFYLKGVAENEYVGRTFSVPEKCRIDDF